MINNSIEWIFEKIFYRIIKIIGDFNNLPFNIITEKTFYNNYVHSIISKNTIFSISDVEKYLTNYLFIEKFINKILEKEHSEFLLNDYVDKYDEKITKLVLINNKFEHLKKINTYTMDMLIFPARFGYTDTYFYLRNYVKPTNSHIMNNAINSNLDIVKDVNYFVEFSNDNIETIFTNNDTSIIEFVIESGKKINNEYYKYCVVNLNYIILQKYQKNIKWTKDFYYSAILSGSIEMFDFLRQFIYVDNDSLELDKIKSRKVFKGNITNDMIYYSNGHKFSNCINYAVQSNSTSMINFILDLGYKITPSNFFTAIKQSNYEILEIISKNYLGKLPYYTIIYITPHSPCNFKEEKIKIINKYKLIDICNKRDYKMESLHLKIATENYLIRNENFYDEDYLLENHLFFDSKNLHLFYAKLLVDDFDSLIIFLNNGYNNEEWKLISNIIYLYSDLKIIRKCYSEGKILKPSTELVCELISRIQIGKLSFLLNHNLIDDYDKIMSLSEMIDNKMITQIFSRKKMFDV